MYKNISPQLKDGWEKELERMTASTGAGDAYTIMTTARTEPQHVFCSRNDELLDCLFTGALGSVV